MNASATPRRTQAERKAESDARIIAAAVELFAERGYVSTTLNQIGDRAGYTGGLVSNRFGSKVQLLHAVLDDIYEKFTRETMLRLDGVDSVLERLDLYADVFLDRVTRPRSEVHALYVVMGEAIGAVPEIREEVAEFTEHTVRSVARLIEEGVASGELRPDLRPLEAASLLLAMMRGLTLQHLAGPGLIVMKHVRVEIHNMLANWKNPETG